MFKYQDVQKWIQFNHTKIDQTPKQQWYENRVHNDYFLNVNIAALKCKYEIGPNFTWAICAQYAECSPSTVRKYYYEYFSIPQWWLDEAKEKALQAQQKTLLRNQDIAAAGNLIIENYKHIDPADLPIYMQGSLVFHSLNEYKHWPGLYLIAQTYLDVEKEEVWYFCKIGKGVDIARRLKDYNTHNPNYRIVDVKYCKENEIDALEIEWQTKLSKLGTHMGDNQEWFIISRATYLKIIKQGFKAI